MQAQQENKTSQVVFKKEEKKKKKKGKKGRGGTKQNKNPDLNSGYGSRQV